MPGQQPTAPTPGRATASPRALELVGREREMAALERALAQGRAGEFRCVLVRGEPGVGKTRLGAELIDRHRPETLVATGRAYPLGATTPFGLWADALEPLLQTFGPAQVAALCGGFVDDLARLIPTVADARGSVPDHDGPRLRVLEGLSRLLRGLAERRPVVVLLDDVHLADGSSWDALAHLARRLADARVLVVATARPAELAEHDAATRVLVDLDGSDRLETLDVDPLDRPGLAGLASGLLGRPAPERLVDWLAGRSRGNPLFAIGLVRALVEEDADLANPHLERLPESLAERVVARTRLLDEPARSALEVLAVVGHPVPIEVVAAVAGHPVDRMARTLGRLVASRAVVEVERGREVTYDIHHPVVADALYQQVGKARRRVLHRQVAEALESRRGPGNRPGEAARHLARAASVGDPEAIAALVEALAVAEQQEAYREALELLDELVELLPAGDERWLGVLDAFAPDAEWVVDHRAEAHGAVAVKALRAVADVAGHSSDLRLRAAVQFRLGTFLAWGTGELEEAERAMADARRLYEAAGERRPMLLAAREGAWIRGLRGDLPGMEDDAGAVAAAAEVAGERFVLMQALAAQAFAALLRGRFPQSERALTGALTIAREDGKSYRLTNLLAQQGITLTYQGRFGEALAAFDEGQQRHPGDRETILVELEVHGRWVAGDIRGALHAARAGGLFRPERATRRRSQAVALAGLCLAETGELAEARRIVAGAQVAFGGRDWTVHRQYTDYAAALLTWWEGRGDEALAGLERVAARLLDMEARVHAAFVLSDLAELAAEQSAAGPAQAAAEHLAAIARAIPLDLYRGMAALAAAWSGMAAGEGEQPSTAEAARSAIASLERTGCRGLRGRAHEVLGRASAAERTAAVSDLRRAAALFDEDGAIRRRDRVLQALHRLGSPGRRAAAGFLGAGSLSPRERDVARLAAEGLSARQIAERLFVGERTVATHLTAVYAKLGVRSKVELVRRAAELAL